MSHKLPAMAKIADRDGGWFCAYCWIPLVPRTESYPRYVEGCTRDWRGRWNPPPGMAWPQRDHVVPLSRGGRKQAIANLVLACWPCNCEKFNRTGDEYRTALLEAALLDSVVGR